jgi:integrase
MAEPLNPEAYLFPNRYGHPISVVHAWRVLLRACGEVSIAGRVGLHSMRKSFAQAVHEATGNDLFKTQQLLGHSSPLTTVRYLESSQPELDAVVLSLGVPRSPFPASARLSAPLRLTSR